MKDLSDLRENYQKGELLEENLPKSPFDLFSNWFKEALEAKITDPNAFTLATLGLNGFPNARVVLLKSLTEEGFTFFTNYESEKGKEIAQNGKGSMVFLWKELERQVRMQGIIKKVPENVSDEYYKKRPAGSRLGAWSSPQSQKIASRQVLEELLAEQTKKHGTEPTERPEFWGGYIVVPHSIEFWQGRPSRLHDRIRYVSNGNTWEFERLAP